MILLTVGTDGPFDRLVRAVDEWAGATGRTDIVAQVGRTKFSPRFMKSFEFLEPPVFREYFEAAEVVVAHAGMGTILSALRYNKPLVIMPRRASLGEQRNEHQLATAKRLGEIGAVTVAADEDELIRLLNRTSELRVTKSIGPYAQPQLLEALQMFIRDSAMPASARSVQAPLVAQENRNG